jgi:hypothetical protein
MSKSASSAAAPEHPPYSEQAPRFLPLETIRVRLASPPHTNRRPVFGIISNMSETGACIITNLALPEGAAVSLTIENQHRTSALAVSARVVWCAERFEPVKEIVGVLTGVCFEARAIEEVRSLLACGLFQAIP